MDEISNGAFKFLSPTLTLRNGKSINLRSFNSRKSHNSEVVNPRSLQRLEEMIKELKDWAG
jgi:hypothetical protein